MIKTPQEIYEMGEVAIAALTPILEEKSVEKLEDVLGIGKTARITWAVEALLKRYNAMQPFIKRIIEAKTDEDRDAARQAIAGWIAQNPDLANLEYCVDFSLLKRAAHILALTEEVS